VKVTVGLIGAVGVDWARVVVIVPVSGKKSWVE
jgi:hypothetical protein